MKLMAYINKNSDFYESIANNYSIDELYTIKNIPHNYKVLHSDENYWTNYMNSDSKLLEQGWKIHVSSRYEESQECLDKVSEYLFKKGIDFKHLSSRFIFKLSVSKNADRVSAGKFITIYPREDQLKNVLTDLEDIIDNIDILNTRV